MIAAELHHRHEQRYELYAYVIMNDHVHVLLRTLDDEPLEKIIHSWKSFTAHAMQRRHGRRGRVWQDEYFSTGLSAMKKSWDKNSTIYWGIRLLGGLSLRSIAGFGRENR